MIVVRRQKRRFEPAIADDFLALLIQRRISGRICAAQELKQFPAYLNRWDSQQARNEGVFAH